MEGGIGEKELKDRAVEKVMQLSSTSRFSEALEVCRTIDFRRLDDAERRRLISYIWFDATALADDSDEELRAYEDVIALGDLILEGGDERDRGVKVLVAMAFTYRAATLAAMGRLDEAISSCDEVVARYGGSEEAPIREQVARALLNRGVFSGLKGDGDGEMEAYAGLLDRFEGDDYPAVREIVARALFNRGVLLRLRGRPAEASAVFDELITRCRAGGEMLSRLEARALVARALAHIESGEAGWPEDLFEKALKKCDDDEHLWRMDRILALAGLGKLAEAEDALRALLEEDAIGEGSSDEFLHDLEAMAASGASPPFVADFLVRSRAMLGVPAAG